MDIISAYQQVGSYRAAAELCGTTHKTVKRVVEKFEAGDAAPPRAERAHNYDAVTELVAERVKKSAGRMSAKRMLPIARAAGYDGSARNFRRLVAEAKTLWRNEHHRGRRPAVWSPGEYLVIDWAEAAPGLFLFCAVLAFSRWRFVAFATDQRASTTLALIAEAIAAIGGVPARVLADRMACLKGGVVANVVIPTRRICPAGRPLRVRPGLLPRHPTRNQRASWRTCAATPNATWRCHCSPRPPSPGHRLICGPPTPRPGRGVSEVNAAVHSEICAVPDERLLIERELLQPLPSLRLQIGAPSVIRKVDRLSCVRYASARYSVPTRLIGASVAVVVDHGAVCIVEPATGMIVAEHELGAPGSASILDAHYDGPRPAPNRGPRPRTTIEQQFCAPRRGCRRRSWSVPPRSATPGWGRSWRSCSGSVPRTAPTRCSPRCAGRWRSGGSAPPMSAPSWPPAREHPQPRPAGDALILDLPVAPTRSLDAYTITPAADGGVTS